MRTILVSKDLDINAGITGINDVNSLTEGAIGIFTEKNTLLTPDSTANVAGDLDGALGIRFVLGKNATDDSLNWSPMIPLTARVVRTNYAAPTKKKMAIGAEKTSSPIGSLNAPSTLVAGTVATITIMDTTDAIRPPKRMYQLEHRVLASDTITTICASLIAKNAAHPNKFVTLAAITISSATAGLTVTADDYDVDFSIAVDGILANAVIVSKSKNPTSTDVVACFSGTNRGVQVLELEKSLSGYLGNTSQLYLAQQLFKQAMNTDTSVNYITYAFYWEETGKGSWADKNNGTSEFILALPTGGTNLDATALGNLENLLNEGFNLSVPSTLAGV